MFKFLKNMFDKIQHERTIKIKERDTNDQRC